MRRDQGIALLNALVIVAAIAAIAAGLMLRAEGSRARLAQMRETGQADLYLDAAEARVLALLHADRQIDAGVDHLGEDWAVLPVYLALSQGQASGRITDLQARFNVNWLSNDQDPDALRSFERLFEILELPVPLAREVASFVRPRGPADGARYLDRDLPVLPAQGPLDTVQQLRLVQGMTPQHFERLRPYVAALPYESAINVNTAPVAVLAALMPTASLDGINQMLVYRAERPFASGSEFTDRAHRMIHSRVIEQANFPGGGFSTRSQWFEARLVAEMDSLRRTRHVVIRRVGTSPDKFKLTRAAGPY